MAETSINYADAPEALVVGAARTGDRDAFADLVRRRQSWIRNVMRRCCGDAALADDLSQQVFLQAWRGIAYLREPQKFGTWLKRLAVNTWLQHLRANDALRNADSIDEDEPAPRLSPETVLDLDRALALLAAPVRLCVVLSYHEGMTHPEIADVTGLPLGTVKSHVRRGTQQIRHILSAYRETIETENAR